MCLNFQLSAGARLAQSVKRKALNLVVVGSSPTVGVAAERRHGRGDTGAQEEGGRAKEPATRDALREAKLSVSLRSVKTT